MRLRLRLSPLGKCERSAQNDDQQWVILPSSVICWCFLVFVWKRIYTTVNVKNLLDDMTTRWTRSLPQGAAAGWCIKYSKPDLILRLFSLLHPELWTLCSAPCWNCLMLKFNSCSPVTFASFHVSCRVTSDRTVLLRPAAVCHKCSFGTDDLRWSCFQECSRHTLSVMTE